jgi:hypothetical protein
MRTRIDLPSLARQGKSVAAQGILLCLVLALVAGCSRSAPDADLDPDEEVDTICIDHRDLPAANHNPDATERKRLRVQWGKPRLMEGDQSSLEFMGVLLLASEDGKSQKPVDWPQPLRVVLAKTAQDRPDWSQRHSRRNSVWADTIVGRGPPLGSLATFHHDDEARPIPRRAGQFIATMPLGELHREIGQTKAFQIGLCLGVKKGTTLTWTNTSPILPDTVSTIEIPGPKALAATLQLINACPTPLGWDYDPLALVRASNHLRSLGKDRTIKALREFVRIARDPGYGGNERRDPEDIDTSNQWCLATLVPLVFEKASPKDEDPPLWTHEITIWEGIPFHNVRIGATTGWPPRSEPLVEWAAKHGKLIVRPLIPTDRPLEAADGLFDELGRTKNRERELRQHLRLQAWRMIGQLVEPGSQPRKADAERLDSEPEWKRLKARAARLTIRWSKERQEYVRGVR